MQGLPYTQHVNMISAITPCACAGVYNTKTFVYMQVPRHVVLSFHYPCTISWSVQYNTACTYTHGNNKTKLSIHFYYNNIVKTLNIKLVKKLQL